MLSSGPETLGQLSAKRHNTLIKAACGILDLPGGVPGEGVLFIGGLTRPEAERIACV